MRRIAVSQPELPELPPSGSLSGAALSPCHDGGSGAASPSEPSPPPLPSAPANLPLTGLKRTLRELAQEICGLIGELADIDRPRRTTVESCWFFDELGSRADRIESQAKLLRHMADVMWEQAYREGVRRRQYHEPATLDEFDQSASVSGTQQLANGVRF
jgi:hypothetical protein